MKKIFSLILALACAMSLSACGSKDEDKKEEKEEISIETGIKEAVWEGYDSMPFIDFLEEGLAKLYGDGYEINVTYKDGWADPKNFKDDVISEGASPVTFAIEVHNIETDDFATFFFFAEQNGNILSVQGATVVTAGTIDYASKDKAADLLNQVKESLE